MPGFVDVHRVNRDLAGLAPALTGIVPDLIDGARKAGLCVGIFETLRSVDRQDFLYETGASKVKGDSLAAKHVQGRAIDVVFLDWYGRWSWSNHWDWEMLGGIGEGLGLIWGGRWESFPDKAHFQLEDNA